MTLAIIFESVGIGEWFVLLAVLLIVVGPKRLPETARKFGQYYSKFRRAADGFKRQLMEMDTELDTTVRKVEREVSEATDGAVAPTPEYEDYGVGPEDFDAETDYGAMGVNPPEQDADQAASGAAEAAAPSASSPAPATPPPAKPAHDLAAVKISVSPAPTGKAAHGN